MGANPPLRRFAGWPREKATGIRSVQDSDSLKVRQ